MRILTFNQFNDEIELGSSATLSFEFGPGRAVLRKRGRPLQIIQPPQILSGVRNNGMNL